MATAEKSGPLKYKNQSGDVTIFYPVTLKENVAGMEGIDAHLVDRNNPHQVTAEQVGADASGSAAAVQTKLDTHTANRNNTRHAICSTFVFTELIRLSRKIAQLAAIKEAFGFCEI